MSPVRIAVAILLASAFAPAAPAVADPAYLPPFVDRAPALGDRWAYAAYDVLGAQVGSVTVEVVEVEETADGWRYLVEDQLEFLPGDPSAAVQPVLRNEWFRGADGSIWRGDLWVDGELAVDLPKPLLVVRRLFKEHRFGHLGWPVPVKRRGRIDAGLFLSESDTWIAVELRLGDRSRPTVWAIYDVGRHRLGRLGWTNRDGLHRTLVSAVIDGVAYEP